MYNYCMSVTYPEDAKLTVTVGGCGGTVGFGNTDGAEFVGHDLYNKLKDFLKAFVFQVLQASSLFSFSIASIFSLLRQLDCSFF